MTIECYQCGECCLHLSSVRITKEELEILRQFGDPDVIPEDNGKFQMTLPCDFQGDDNRCTIHDVRPCMCRMWHCGKLSPDGYILSWMSEIQDLMAKNPEYREFKTKMEDEAVAWGNAHGWHWKKMGAFPFSGISLE